MATNDNTLPVTLRDEIVALLAPLVDATRRPVGVKLLMQSMGRTDEVGGRADLRREIERLGGLAQEIVDLQPEMLDSWSGVARLLALADDLFSSARGVEHLVQDPTLADQTRDLGRDLIEQLLAMHLRVRHPTLFRAACLLTLVTPAEIASAQPMVADGAKVVRLPWCGDRLQLERVDAILQRPLPTLSEHYFPNRLDTAADAHESARRLFPLLRLLAHTLGLKCFEDRVAVGPPSAPLPVELNESDHFGDDEHDADALAVEFPQAESVDLRPYLESVEPRFVIVLPGQVSDGVAAPARFAVAARVTSARHPAAAHGLIIELLGQLAFTETRDGWRLTLESEGSVPGFVFGPDGAALAPDALADATASAKLRIEREAAAGALAFVFGASTSTRLEIGALQLDADLRATGSSAVVLLAIYAQSGALVLAPADGDGFLSSILPAKGMRANFDLGLAWSNERGLTLRGSTGLDATLPIGLAIGGLKVPTVHLRLHAGDKGLETEASATLVLRLGPVEATIERVGLAADLTFPQTGGNLGVADLDFRFKPPTGVGLTIDAGVVHGGGFLSFDPQQAQYAGVLYLEMQGGIAVRALGLIHTRLPGGQNGFSLVVVITAEGFKPIPLGLGFMLRGIGGLLGIHRTANEDAIQLGMRANTLDGILAPADPVRNGPQYLSALNTVFPPAQDHHLFGPVVQITWGTPPLAIIRLAFIVEFGVRTRALMVGHLSAILPRQELDLVRLQMYVFGGIDFAQERAFLDAVLHDSRLLNKYVITGEMRMRMTWNRNPSFILAIGGVHPDFTPPPGLEPMPRLAIVLANSDDLKLRCEAYFAITSNTVQFGAHVHLFAKKSKFSVEGMAGFDVLIQFNPFHFVAALHASLELKAFGRSLFMVSFEGELSGPRPLHVRGKATFKIWIFRKSVSFDTTLIEGESPPVPESTDVARLLREALSQPAAWSAALPRTLSRLVSLREIDDSTGIRMHPLGLLTIKQNVVPLNLLITRFGTTPVAGGPQEFQIQQLQIGIGGVDTEPVRDHFAPAQFRDMSDDEKLSSPSFELLEAGIQATTQQAEHGAPLTTTVEYEEKIIPKPAGPPPPRHTMDAGIAARLSRWSAAGLHAAKHSGPNRYRAPALKLPTRSKIFRLVSKSNLTKRLNSTDFVTYAEADAAKRKLNFTEQAGLQIVAVTP
ncbi:conserved protein of unknown function [Nitrospira japonica]|uniref:DUF6603 domain-containing protein n=1 Tax=Nitrospira japonica TaxID=1325564 RepID=A0A1W1I355_9BACT|nr:DUF6603 domain-containing protein [Nitrospira japonica]SLM47440.1 conserved protein of unknown function [Nitrospira japonica]